MKKRCGCHSALVTVVLLLSLCVFQKGVAKLLLQYTFDDGYTSVSNHALSEVPGGVYVGGASCWGVSGLITPGNFAARMGTNDVSSYVETTADSDELDELGPVTITAWINLQSLPDNNDRIASKLSYSGGYYEGFDLRFTRDGDDLQLSFSLCNGVSAGLPTHNSEVISQDLLGTGAWRFLAVTYSGAGVASFFIGKTTDDSLVQLSSSGTSFDAGGAADTTSRFRVGSTQASGADRTPDMFIDDVRIYNTVLGSNELDVVRCANLRSLDEEEQNVLSQVASVKSDAVIRDGVAGVGVEGGIVDIDPGIYRVSTPLRLPSNVALVCSDASNATILAEAPDQYIPLITNEDWINGNTGISLLNMTLDGCAAVQRSNKTCVTRYSSGLLSDIDGVGVYFRNVIDFEVDHMRFQNLPNEAVYLLHCNRSDSGAPGNLSAEASSQAVSGIAGSVVLSWREQPGVSVYRVRRGAFPGGPYGTIVGDVTNAAAMIDWSAPTNSTSYYTVSCLVSGVEGATSSELAARPGLIVDDSTVSSVTFNGSWIASTSVSGFVGNCYFHDGNVSTEQKSVVFTPDLPVAGNYRIYLRWTDGSNRAENVPVTISCNGQHYIRHVNQKADGGLWVCLGDFDVADTQDISVKVANYYDDGSQVDGYVIADSVYFVLSDVAGNIRNSGFYNCSQLSYINNNAQGAVYVRESGRISVRENDVENCDEGGIVCGYGANNNFIEYNTMTNCVSGEGVYLGVCSDNKVQFNCIDNVSKASQLDPWVAGSGAGVAAFAVGSSGETVNNEISYNCISDVGGSGVSVYCDTTAVLSNLLVSGNSVRQFNVNDIAGKAGVSLWRVSDIQVSDNVCTDGNSGVNPAPGVKVCYSDSVFVDGNILTNNPGGDVVILLSTNVTGNNLP